MTPDSRRRRNEKEPLDAGVCAFCSKSPAPILQGGRSERFCKQQHFEMWKIALAEEAPHPTVYNCTWGDGAITGNRCVNLVVKQAPAEWPERLKLPASFHSWECMRQWTSGILGAFEGKPDIQAYLTELWLVADRRRT